MSQPWRSRLLRLWLVSSVLWTAASVTCIHLVQLIPTNRLAWKYYFHIPERWRRHLTLRCHFRDALPRLLLISVRLRCEVSPWLFNNSIVAWSQSAVFIASRSAGSIVFLLLSSFSEFRGVCTWEGDRFFSGYWTRSYMFLQFELRKRLWIWEVSGIAQLEFGGFGGHSAKHDDWEFIELYVV